jgi:DNA repair protein RadC
MARITVRVADRPEVYGSALVTPQSVADEFSEIGRMEQESFWVVGLNVKHRTIFKQMISLGCIDSTTVDMRILFKTILVRGCCGFIVLHNHPSGITQPSSDDRALTRTITEAAKLLGLNFLDHLIVAHDEGKNKYYSFKENGGI